MDSKCTTEQYENIQIDIKESSLQAYKDWVNDRVVEMEKQTPVITQGRCSQSPISYPEKQNHHLRT